MPRTVRLAAGEPFQRLTAVVVHVTLGWNTRRVYPDQVCGKKDSNGTIGHVKLF